MRHAIGRTALTLVLLGGLVAPITAHAQAQALVPSGTGFSMAGSAVIARSRTDGTELDGTATPLRGSSSTVRGALELAYGASPRLSLIAAVVALPGTSNGFRYGLNGVQVGMRYLGLAGSPLRPFVDGGFAVRKIALSLPGFTKQSTNVGPWASIGAIRMMPSHWSAEGAVMWTSSSFDNWLQNGQAVTSPTIRWNAVGARVGVRYWVRAR